MVPTIAQVLALPPVAAGRPSVLTGTDALDRAVRWVHVAPPPGGRRLLLGGELLLSTGVGWPTDPGGLRAYVQELSAASVTGLVLELGNQFDEPPGPLVAACRDSGLPLIILEQEVRFVTITEAVHCLILDNQTAALRERDQVHGVFTELNRRGCSTGFLLEQAACMLHKPVVLEDLNHRAVAWSSYGRAPATLLVNWAGASRRAAQQAVARPAPHERTSHWPEGGWLRAPVEAQGRRWGTLVALECSDVSGMGEVVLENAALALSLGRLGGRGSDEWATLGQRHLLDSFMTGAYVRLDDLRTTFEASGFRVSDRDMVAVARRSERGTVSKRIEEVRNRAAGLDIDVISGPWADDPQTTALFLLSLKRGRSDRAEAIMSLLEGNVPDRDRPPSIVAVGAEVTSFTELLQSTEEAISLLQATPALPSRDTLVRHSRTAALDLLLNRNRCDPTVQSFVERVLGPLLAHDAQNHGDLLQVARACVQYPTNRKRAAAACHLSRSVFYQRMQLIENLLEADLDDGHTLAALHVALVAYGQRALPN